jgi:hypothetical protein
MCQRSRLGRPRQALRFFLAVSLFAAPGCWRGAENSIPSGAHEIAMVVLKGPRHETLALVPVFIGDKGPFAFALDTGASRTVVDRRIAAELGLPVAGGEVQVSGVGGNAVAQPVRVDRFSADNIWAIIGGGGRAVERYKLEPDRQSERSE